MECTDHSRLPSCFKSLLPHGRRLLRRHPTRLRAFHIHPLPPTASADTRRLPIEKSGDDTSTSASTISTIALPRPRSHRHRHRHPHSTIAPSVHDLGIIVQSTTPTSACSLSSPPQLSLLRICTPVRCISMEWTGSPFKKASASFTIYDENEHAQVCAIHLLPTCCRNLI